MQQKRGFFFFSKFGVVDLFTPPGYFCPAEQLVKNTFVNVGALTQIDTGKMKSENMTGLDQFGKAQVGDNGAMMLFERLGQD